MGERKRAWLVGAIRGGKSNDARLRLLGDLRDFPFVDPAKGQFRIQAQVREATLEYAQGWPPVQDIDGELLFDRNRMEITGRRARILGAGVADVRVAIARLGPGAELQIQGGAQGRTAEFLDYIRQSPVRGMIGGFTDEISASGSGRLRLRLVLPLAQLAASRVEGEYRFIGNTVHFDPLLPPLERASGTLSFTERSFSISETSGRIFGGPIALNGGTSRGGELSVVARGSFTVAGVEPLLGRAWQGILQGSAPYTATVSTRSNRAPRVVFESNLVGVSSELPPPLAKPANTALPLRVAVVAGEAGQRSFITLGRLLRAELLRQGEGEKSLERAAVAFSPPGGPLRMPQERGTVLLYGTLESLELERWLPLFARSASGEGGAGEGLQLRTDLRIGTLDALGKRLSGIVVKAGTQKEGWSVDLESAQVSGQLAYRTADGGKLVARLSRFAIPPDIPGAQAARDLADLPALDLVADSFSLRGKELGSVQIVAHHAGADWVLERVAMRNLDSSLVATGLWRTGAGASTSLSVDVEASDVGLMLERFGQPGLVKGGNAKAQASVSWNGGPTAIDYASLAGRVEAHAADGQFLEIDPGVGKLVALMSLQMLPQRITLDFRDVFSKGFQWDRIDATAQIERGVLDTQDFRMRGSAADVVMKGQADLARETQDLLVRVTPKLGDSAATVVGIINPVAGIVTFLGQRVLKDPLGQMFAFEYGITGSWADPKVAKLKPTASAEVPTPPSGN
jgi:uncharacterized protein (TIGR02099 family)